MYYKFFRLLPCLILALIISFAGFSPALAAAPLNDNFADAEVINSLPFNATADVTESTAETGEPLNCTTVLNRTVWYSFTPTETMSVHVDMQGGATDGLINIYHATGTGISDLQYLQCVVNPGSSSTFLAEAGQTYYLQVSNNVGGSGTFQVNLQQVFPPANDVFANAEVITSLPFSASPDLTDTTVEPNEPNNCFSPQTVWYSFTPAQTMSIRVDTQGGVVNGIVGIYRATGTGISNLQFLTCAYSIGSTFLAEAGQTYYLQASPNGGTGTIQINLQQVFPPANDVFANAEVITTLPFTTTVDMTDTGFESGESNNCGYQQTVWYSFTPAQTMTIRVDASGSGVSSLVDIYHATGSGISNLQHLKCVYGSSTTFLAEAGQTYYLQASPNGGNSTIQINLQQVFPPANDIFANAEVISSIPFTASVDMTDTGVEPGEPNTCGLSQQTVWYSITPAQTMSIRVDTQGSVVSGLVSIYHSTGSGFPNLHYLTCAYTDNPSTFLAEVGETYYLQASLNGGVNGTIQVNLQQVFPPANDIFANAEVISSLPFTATVDMTDTGIEPGEPNTCGFPQHTVWYSFTPAQTMSIRADTQGGTVNSLVGIYHATGSGISNLQFLKCSDSIGSAFLAEAGQTYYLQVSPNGGNGTIQINLQQVFPPANDAFANTEVISSLPFTATVDMTNTGVEPGEPNTCSFTQQTVWYSITPTQTMSIRVDTLGGAVSGAVSIYHATGSGISNLQFLKCVYSSSPSTFLAEAGETYYLQAIFYEGVGSIQINLQQVFPPANDSFANAQAITSLPFSASPDITDTSVEPNEPTNCGYQRTVWYSFTPSQTMSIRVDTLGGAVNGAVGVYHATGSGISNLQFLICAYIGSSSSTFLAEAGETYYLQASPNGGGTGTIQVNLQQVIPPANDNFINSVVVNSLPLSVSVDITVASSESGEPQNCYSMNQTVWYSFTPAEATKIRVDTQGSAINGNVNIYHATGTGLSNLQFMQCSGPYSALTFSAEAGQTYYFQVGAAYGDAGTVHVNLAEMAPITGRIIDAVTNAPLPSASVTLQRVCGDGCLEYVNSQQADSEGRFTFDSYSYGSPLVTGTYQIQITADQYQPKQFGPFGFSGAKLDLGDIPLNAPPFIRGRTVDGGTSDPLPGVSVTLRRCDSSGCLEYVNAQSSDNLGQFQFDSYYYGAPLPAGTYELELSAFLHETKRVQVVIIDGENHDLGDVLIDPLPLIGSINGRLVDAATGKPVTQDFTPSVQLYFYNNAGYFEMVNSQVPGNDGKFRFETDSAGNPLPAGTYQITASADQYQQAQSNPFAVGEGANRTLSNLRITSFPVRFSELQPCADIPASGGRCAFSVKITNGTSKTLKAAAWSLVNSSLPDSFAGYTNFQTKDPQDLDLDRGKDKVLRFQFNIPANKGSYGSYICTRILMGQGNNSFFNTIGARGLFCILWNANGFTIASPQEVTALAQNNLSVAATGTDIEPNNSCQAAQDVGAISFPFAIDGNLDSSQSPDVDFYRFIGAAGKLVTVDLEGEGTGKGTLGDPFLGFFDSNCNLVAQDDGGGGALNSRLEITIPVDGVFVLGATGCCDSGFIGGINGSYQLTVSPVQVIGSISGRVIDSATRKPVRGDAAPFAFVRLLQCDGFGCSDVNNQTVGSDGSFSFSSKQNGDPLRAANYRVVISADQYQTSQTDMFAVGENKNYDTGAVPLTSFPVRFSDIQPCVIPSAGGSCQFSVKITNGLSTRLIGKVWSIINGSGIGSFINSTDFQTDTPGDVRLDSGKSSVLRFRFRVPGSVANGAYICSTVYVGQGSNAFFNVSGQSFLFCFVKGSNGFTLMPDQQAQETLQQMQIQEVAPPKTPVENKK